MVELAENKEMSTSGWERKEERKKNRNRGEPRRCTRRSHKIRSGTGLTSGVHTVEVYIHSTVRLRMYPLTSAVFSFPPLWYLQPLPVFYEGFLHFERERSISSVFSSSLPPSWTLQI